jgi:hypothetical protein
MNKYSISRSQLERGQVVDEKQKKSKKQQQKWAKKKKKRKQKTIILTRMNRSINLGILGNMSPGHNLVNATVAFKTAPFPAQYRPFIADIKEASIWSTKAVPENKIEKRVSLDHTRPCIYT